MLGLQIWICTVFRIARQFLTSACDVLRVAGKERFFYPRKHRELVKRVVFDFKFLRRFINNAPRMGFKNILGRLPESGVKLSSDASSKFGMGGLLLFKHRVGTNTGVQGLFWQYTWEE